MAQKLPNIHKDALAPIDMVRYSGASGDFNEIHTVPKVARQKGLKEPIAHGMLLMGWAAEAIEEWLPDRKLNKFTVRFVSMAHAGEAFVIEGMLTTENAGELQIKDTSGTGKLVGSFEME
ncbi:3-hydroxyacyl-ACP dehydratase [Planococcus sp. CP5-4]|uniref:MaoC/PaaZ C-terminal domain-containing protein n=1 Tax=unclassified Planococcus (in: firmicutes) TaxID=2662419 RepID=UPI001C228FB6|nr:MULTISPECIES: MaoC/PaaZ C-terminal domain-containing protein [unclassified Planococcus (in: firmicutes)]MBU9673168.1 3-hydroxyacyl-ACP dehydratase [Planococcus sp. CP5-4_YE]MBW6062476.1 3-hydroxyacyl-ACP dehydratase [Planococcus sp. CP5-4]